MFVDLSLNSILMTAGAFLIGWILSAISSRFSAKNRASARDPRDDRIRSLEAELRVAQSKNEKATAQAEQLEDEIKEANVGMEKRDNVISHQQSKLDGAQSDLKDSVIKTRELRVELTERATENVKSEAKQRELQTELEVAQASTDLLATGVLDYSLTTEGDEFDDRKVNKGKDSRRASS